MYQITGKQASFRVTDFEREKLNKIAETLQIESNVEFQNAKELIFAIINKLDDLAAAAPKTIEVEKEVTVEVLPEDLKTKFEELRVSIFENEDIAPLSILETMEMLINTPTQAVEVPVEKIVEVERPLTENEMVVNIQPKQKQLLVNIASWRHNRGYDKVLNHPGDILRRMAFQKAVLVDWNDEFPTGLTRKNLNN